MRFISAALIVAGLSISAVVQADQLTAEKAADTKRLVNIVVSDKDAGMLAANLANAFIQGAKRSNPQLSDRAIQVINKEIGNLVAENWSAPGGMVERSVAIYAKHYTHQEIKDLLAFYQTPTGKKSLSAFPVLMTESIGASQAWVQSMTPVMQARIAFAMRREGVLR